MPEPLLQIKNLTKEFPVKGGFWGKSKGSVKAVNGVSLELYPGEVLGLVGESGCGKSTLGRIVLKLIEPDGGQIIYLGQDITNYTQREMRPLRRDMQIIFQDPFSSLNPRMTIGSALMEPLEIHKIVPRSERYHKAVDLLNLVGLSEEAMARYPHEFSGGQRQRIGIARALSVNPKLIIADEAVSALDISIQAQIINLLADLKEKLGLTMLFIAHDLKVVEHISDRICVMYLGRVMEIFSAHHMKSPATSNGESSLGQRNFSPQVVGYKTPYGGIKEACHPYTLSLLSAVPIPDPTVKVTRQILKGEIPSAIHPPSGCVFHTRCPLAQESCKQNVPPLREISPGHFLACDLV